jgi:tripartite-type tricarboxylate transporter receptor subunit TctC
MSRILRKTLVVLVALLGFGLTACASRDDYPSRPVTLIVPWAPGGGTDRIARQLAVGLEAELEVPVNVVNAVGGGGVLGHTRGAVARPDGYTLTFATAELNMLHWRDITPLNYHDFEPVLLVNRDDAAILVPLDSPWQSASELADSIRSRPRTLLASGTAFGGIWHLAVAGWLSDQGIPPEDLTLISMNSAQPAFQEMIAGRLDVVVTSLPEAKAMIETGAMRPRTPQSARRWSPARRDLP